MANKYSKVLERREINEKTGKVWSINDVPNLWRAKTKTQVLSDGFHFAADGTAYPNGGGN